MVLKKLINLIVTNRIPNFHLLFLMVYFFYNIIGLIDFSFYRYPLSNRLVLIFLVGLIGFFMGIFFGKIVLKIVLKEKKFSYADFIFFKIDNFFDVIGFFWFFLVCIFSIYLNKNGIIVLDFYKRFDAPPSIYFFISTFFVYSYYLFYKRIVLRVKNVSSFLVLFVYFLIILSLGYRALIINFIGGYILFSIIYISTYKKYDNFLKISILSLFLLLFSILIQYYRVSILDTDVFRHFLNIDISKIPRKLYIFVPFLSMARYDQEVGEMLVEFVNNNDYYYGKLLLSNFLTILPGTQPSARDIIAQIASSFTYSQLKRQPSITTVLQINLYCDGGYVLVFFGFFLISSLMYLLKSKLRRKYEPFLLSLYIFLSVNFLKSVHTGYFDVSTVLIIILFLFFYFLEKVKRKKIVVNECFNNFNYR